MRKRKKKEPRCERQICPVTGKKMHPSEEHALHDATRVILAGKAIWMRAYVCPHCATWHLTSQPERLSNLLEERNIP